MTTEELLARLDERTKQMHEDFQQFLKRAENGGWGRCVERGSRITAVEDKVKDHIGDHKWINRMIATVVLTEMVQAFFVFVAPRI